MWVSTGSGWFLLYLNDGQTHFGLSPTSETIYYNILAVALFTHILKKENTNMTTDSCLQFRKQLTEGNQSRGTLLRKTSVKDFRLGLERKTRLLRLSLP